MSANEDREEKTPDKETESNTSDDQKSDNENREDQRRISLRSGQTPGRCPICLSNMTNRCVIEPCKHDFCLECLQQWMERNNHCPVCRQYCDRILHNIRSETEFETIDVQPPHTVHITEDRLSMYLIGGCLLYVQIFTPGYFIQTTNQRVSLFRGDTTRELNEDTIYHFRTFRGDETLFYGHRSQAVNHILVLFEQYRQQVIGNIIPIFLRNIRLP